MEKKLVDFSQFEDAFGNLKRQFEVIRYDKYADGTWVEEKRHESGRSYYEMDGQLYYRIDNSGIALNMDFDSETCHACYKIGKEITDYKKITGDSILFTCHSAIGDVLRLRKQSYSDDTSFYMLEGQDENYPLHYASRELEELIQSIEREKKDLEQHMDGSLVKENETVKVKFEQLISWKKDILANLKELNAA